MMRNVKWGQGGRISQSDDDDEMIIWWSNLPIAKTFCKSRSSKNRGAICFRRSYVEPRKYLINLTWLTNCNYVKNIVRKVLPECSTICPPPERPKCSICSSEKHKSFPGNSLHRVSFEQIHTVPALAGNHNITNVSSKAKISIAL